MNTGALLIWGKVKVKFTPELATKAQMGSRNIALLFFLTSALDAVGGERHASVALPPGKRPGNNCVGGWVGPTAGLDGCGKSHLHRDSIPGPFSQ